MAGRPHVGGVDQLGLLYPLLLLALAFVPMLLRRLSGSEPGPDDPGGDDGDGAPPPPIQPNRPSDGLPLPDAVPPRARLRDHGRLAEAIPSRPRRPTREPPQRTRISRRP